MAKKAKVDEFNDFPKANAEERKLEKRNRFVRLVGKRLAQLEKRCKHIQAMANKANYTYTEQEAAQILSRCGKAMELIVDAYTRVHESNGVVSFNFSDNVEV